MRVSSEVSYSQSPNICFLVFLFYPEHHEPHSLCFLYFSLPSEPGGSKLTDWAKADLDNIFTTNGSKPGWCNVDPDAAYASKVCFKEECEANMMDFGGVSVKCLLKVFVSINALNMAIAVVGFFR